MDVQPASATGNRIPDPVRALAGAAGGGLVGYFAFGWLVGQGFYALALPGVLIGLGAGWLLRGRSMPTAICCGILALCLGVFAEWRHFPFVKDESFGYFLTHLPDLRPLTLLMLALGTVAAFWFAWRGNGRPASDPSTPTKP